jgi:mRNA interferase MazF
VPITTDRGQRWANVSPDLYPRLPAGIGGLRKPSIVLLDQVQVLDEKLL